MRNQCFQPLSATIWAYLESYGQYHFAMKVLTCFCMISKIQTPPNLKRTAES